jgi:hypothetical protein
MMDLPAVTPTVLINAIRFGSNLSLNDVAMRTGTYGMGTNKMMLVIKLTINMLIYDKISGGMSKNKLMLFLLDQKWFIGTLVKVYL